MHGVKVFVIFSCDSIWAGCLFISVCAQVFPERREDCNDLQAFTIAHEMLTLFP